MVSNLISDNSTNVEDCPEHSTFERRCWEILDALNSGTVLECVQQSMSDLKSAVSQLRDWCIKDDVHHEKNKLHESMMQCKIAFRKAHEAFSDELSGTNKILVVKLLIMSQIISNLTNPEAAIPGSLQSLQELHDLPTVREVFSFRPTLQKATGFRESVIEINQILFDFVQAFFNPPPTVNEWPTTIELFDENIHNPLIDEPSIGVPKLNICEVYNEVQNPVSDVPSYSFTISERCGKTLDNR
jgi:hypothetical protein